MFLVILQPPPLYKMYRTKWYLVSYNPAPFLEHTDRHRNAEWGASTAAKDLLPQCTGISG